MAEKRASRESFGNDREVKIIRGAEGTDEDDDTPAWARRLLQKIDNVGEKVDESLKLARAAKEEAAVATEKVDQLGADMDNVKKEIAELKHNKLQQIVQEAVEEKVKSAMPRSTSLPPQWSHRKDAISANEDIKVRIIGFPTDTRKDLAEGAVCPQLQEFDGFVEAFMPGRKNNFMFAKFDTDAARRRFLNQCACKEVDLKYNDVSLKAIRCRTKEEADRTKHIDKLKRVLCEAISQKYDQVSEQALKDTIITGMNEGGVVWIGDVRIAEMIKGQGPKKFQIHAEKISAEAGKAGWVIDGAQVKLAYDLAMQ